MDNKANNIVILYYNVFNAILFVQLNIILHEAMPSAIIYFIICLLCVCMCVCVCVCVLCVYEDKHANKVYCIVVLNQASIMMTRFTDQTLIALLE